MGHPATGSGAAEPAGPGDGRPLVVVFSPVRLPVAVLRESLHELGGLRRQAVRAEYWFYDDNDDPESSRLLRDFRPDPPAPVRVLPRLVPGPTAYRRLARRHRWDGAAIERMTRIRNLAIREFLDAPARALFLVDADLCLHPDTLEHLHRLGLPVVSEVFWTRWRPASEFLPNVWDYHQYGFAGPQSILRLRRPGQYRVGGLGACTLVQREALERGLSFEPVEGVRFWGEDRHFCIRAACLGYALWADTVHPPYHLYLESQLPRLRRWRAGGYQRAFFEAWLDETWERAITARFGRGVGAWWGRLVSRLRRGLASWAAGAE